MHASCTSREGECKIGKPGGQYRCQEKKLESIGQLILDSDNRIWKAGQGRAGQGKEDNSSSVQVNRNSMTGSPDMSVRALQWATTWRSTAKIWSVRRRV